MMKLSTKHKTLFSLSLLTLTLVFFLLSTKPYKALGATCTHWSGSCMRYCGFPYWRDAISPETDHARSVASGCEEVPTVIMTAGYCGEVWDARLLGCPVVTDTYGNRSTPACTRPD